MRFPDKAMLDSRECLWGMINLTAGLVKQHRASLTSKPDQEGFKAGEAGHEGMYGVPTVPVVLMVHWHRLPWPCLKTHTSRYLDMVQ